MTDYPWLAGVAQRETFAAAAEERQSQRQVSGAGGYRAPADRPRQRRSGEEQTAPARVTARVRDLDVRANDDGSGLLTYEGWPSVTDAPYQMWDWAGPYTEKVSTGAFTTTLARVDLDVPLVLQHQDLRRIARTTNGSLLMDEDAKGLHILAPKLDPADKDVEYIVPKLLSKLIDEMSFKFTIVRGSWSTDWSEYHIEEVDIHRGDVAIVGYGANPHTAGSGLRAVDPLDIVRQLPDEQAREVLSVLNARLGVEPTKTPRALITDEDTRLRVM